MGRVDGQCGAEDEDCNDLDDPETKGQEPLYISMLRVLKKAARTWAC
jgi:hypothetical protein